MMPDRLGEHPERDFAEFLWRKMLPMWTKFCGMVDQYYTVRDKWIFLESSAAGKNIFLPDIEETFAKIDNLVHFAQDKFFGGLFGFNRMEHASYETFYKAVWEFPDSAKRAGFEEGSVRSLFEVYDNLQKFVLVTISNHVAFLMECFNQRTVSDEIPEHIARFSHSLERTFGNELMLRAVDKVSQCYFECFNTSTGDSYSTLKWDRVVSLTYPAGLELYGAKTWWSPLTGLFHISLSEEGKYFPTAYLFIAHEMGHAYTNTATPEKQLLLLGKPWYAEAMAQMDQTDDGDILRKTEEAERLLTESIADVLGVEIAGPALIYALVDMAPNLETLFRVAFMRGFYDTDEERTAFKDLLRTELSALVKYSLATQREKDSRRVLLQRAGLALGAYFFQMQQRYLRDVMESGSEAKWKQVLQDKGLPYTDDSKTSLVSLFFGQRRFVLDDRLKEIESKLRDRTPVTTADPRYILHAYYNAYRESEKKHPPSYAATLHSLAYNTYGKTLARA